MQLSTDEASAHIAIAGSLWNPFLESAFGPFNGLHSISGLCWRWICYTTWDKAGALSFCSLPFFDRGLDLGFDGNFQGKNLAERELKRSRRRIFCYNHFDIM
jgi:hypothetical protein